MQVKISGKNLGNTTLLVPMSDSPEPAGYHTLSMAQVDLKSLPEKHRKGLPKYRIPAVRLSPVGGRSKMAREGFRGNSFVGRYTSIGSSHSRCGG